MRSATLILTIIISFCSVANGQESKIDSTILNVSSAAIGNMQYTALYKSDNYLYIIDSTGNIIFKQKDFHPNFEFKDIDSDGNKDLVISHMTNVPGVQDLLLFDKKNQIFVPVQNFSKFPDHKPIKGTKYFYSYHRSGCADMNWDSDLFFIENFRAKKIGNISGKGCDDENEKKSINIYIFSNDTKSLIETFPIDTIGKYENYKWGFINDYWTSNYKKFEKTVGNKL